jgi:5-hydroxyisourate hydrolase-like protein (transthyretin family)
MKRTYTIILSIFFAILFVTTIESCYIIDDDELNSKCTSDCSTIQGKFTTENGLPVKDVSVEFDWSSSSNMGATAGFGGRIRKIATTKTDNNGEYRIVFHSKDEELISGNYAVQFKVKDNSFLIENNYSYFKIYGVDRRDTVITKNYHLPKKGAAIKIKIKNPSDITVDDQLICTVSYKFGDLSTQLVTGQLFSFIADEATFETAVNQPTYILIAKKKNGEYLNSYDSVIISKGQTLLYEIEF